MMEPIFLRITLLTYIITSLDCLFSDEHHELVSTSVLTVKAFKTRVHRVFPCVRIVRTDDLLSLLLRSFHCHIVFIVHELSLSNNKNFLHIIISFRFVSFLIIAHVFIAKTKRKGPVVMTEPFYFYQNMILFVFFERSMSTLLLSISLFLILFCST